MPVSSVAVLAQVDFPTQLVSGSNWVNAGLGGIAIALIGLIGWLLKLWVSERKESIEQQSKSTERLMQVMDKSNEVIGGNTRAIEAVCRQSEGMAGKVDEMRDRLLRRPCMADEK